MVTPQQEVGESVRCPAWTDTMAYIIINYSWHLSLPRQGGCTGQCQGAQGALESYIALVSLWVRGGEGGGR